MLTAVGEELLEFKRSLLVTFGGRGGFECVDAAHDGVMMGAIAGAEAKFEGDGCAECDLALGDEGSDGCGDMGLCESGEGAGVG